MAGDFNSMKCEEEGSHSYYKTMEDLEFRHFLGKSRIPKMAAIHIQLILSALATGIYPTLFGIWIQQLGKAALSLSIR